MCKADINIENLKLSEKNFVRPNFPGRASFKHNPNPRPPTANRAQSLPFNHHQNQFPNKTYKPVNRKIPNLGSTPIPVYSNPFKPLGSNFVAVISGGEGNVIVVSEVSVGNEGAECISKEYPNSGECKLVGPKGKRASPVSKSTHSPSMETFKTGRKIEVKSGTSSIKYTSDGATSGAGGAVSD